LDLAITNGTIVDESGIFEGTVGIEDGKIKAILAPGIPFETEHVIDADGRLVLPGVVDVHVHMEIPVCGTVSSDDFTSGSIAGAFGGVTTMIDFAMQAKGHSLVEAVERRRGLAERKAAVDFGLHCGVTDWSEQTRREMRKVVDYGVTSFKLFMIYEDRGWMADDGMLYECLAEASRLDAMVGVHAENPWIIRAFARKALASGRKGAILHSLSRPNFSESEAVARATHLASISGASAYIFHMSTAEACDIVENRQRQGYRVFAETCPQYLVLDNSVFRRRAGHLFATCPPVRTQDDQARLWECLEAGVIQVVSTDHCAFTRSQKDMWRGDFRRIPFGLPGIETLLPVLFTHGLLADRISLKTLVEVLCANPAKLFGLYPRKGTIKVGSDADIIIIDPGQERKISPRTLHMNCDYSPYRGHLLRGFPSITILRGRIIQRDGKFSGKPGGGVFLRRT
jgi:dihydropyrimidinase